MWAAKLNKMQKILDEWLTTQVKWMYLGPVFGTDEISKKMPKERKEFMSADGKYRRIMLAVLNSPEVLNICGMDGLLEDLIESNKVRTFNVTMLCPHFRDIKWLSNSRQCCHAHLC